MRVLTLAIALVTLACLAAAQESKTNAIETLEADTSEDRKKKDGMAQIYMGTMMFKSMLSSFYQTISTAIQIKSFGISIIGLVINLGRFLIQLKEHMDKKQHGWGNDRRRVGTVPPIYLSRH